MSFNKNIFCANNNCLSVLTTSMDKYIEGQDYNLQIITPTTIGESINKN